MGQQPVFYLDRRRRLDLWLDLGQNVLQQHDLVVCAVACCPMAEIG